MSLNPRAIAVLGAGFGAQSLARLGFWPGSAEIISIEGGVIVAFHRLGGRLVAWPVDSSMLVTAALVANEPELAASTRIAPVLVAARGQPDAEPVLAAWPRLAPVTLAAPTSAGDEPTLEAMPWRRPMLVAAAPAGGSASLYALPRRAHRIAAWRRNRRLIAAKTSN